MAPFRYATTLAVLLLARLLLPAQAAPQTLYVSTTGSDTASGTLSRPLATLEGARNHIRILESKGLVSRAGVVVFLRGGEYALRRPFQLTAQDNIASASITYQAFKKETVRLTGGQAVAGWQPVTDAAVLAQLPVEARGHVLQADLKAQGITDYGELTPRGFGRPVTPAALELFFGNAPMTLARWPNHGLWARIAGTAADQARDYFSYDGDRPTRWTQAEDAWVHGYWSFEWADTYEKIQTVDIVRRRIHTAAPQGAFGYAPQHRWYVLNLLEELDQPGEWYLSRRTGLLYFWPPFDVRAGQPVVSLAGDLIQLDHVSHVTLRGLTLEACRGTAVTVEHGTQDKIVDCVIRNTGSTGIRIQDSTDTGVQNCDISNTGDGSISLEGGDRKTLTPGRCFVTGCHIHHYSRWDRTYRAGVQVDGVGNRVAHNRIDHAPHTAVLLSGNDNSVEYNEIDHTCQETGDCGAFYMGRDWTMRGNSVRFNYFHDLGGAAGLLGFADVNAIYLDDTAAGTTVYGNICVRAGRGVLVGGGRDNRVDNNIFVDCKTAASLDARGLGWAAPQIAPGGDWQMQQKLADVAYDQPPYSTRYPHLAALLQDNPASPKYDVITHNIIFQCPGGLDLEVAARPGVQVTDNLTNTNPQFVNAAQGDYRLKPSSPAYSIGFRPIPITHIGPGH